MKPHYKNITEAMAVERPGDKIVKILSNKFCIAHSKFTDGTFQKIGTVFGTSGGTTVYMYGNMPSIHSTIERALSAPNIKKECICYDHRENGKMFHYLWKNCDQRKWKKTYRKLSKII